MATQPSCPPSATGSAAAPNGKAARKLPAAPRQHGLSIKICSHSNQSLLFCAQVKYRAVSRIQGTAPEATMSVAPNSGDGKITVPELLQRKSRAAGSYSNSQKITCLTAYDYPTARLLDEAGVDVILVGDSLGMVVLGYDSTLPVTIDEMLHHTRAVRRGAHRALVVGDMPIHTFETPAQAVATAKQFVDAGAQAVKLEGGVSHVAHIEAITDAGI